MQDTAPHPPDAAPRSGSLAGPVAGSSADSSADRLAGWVRLMQTAGVGPATCRLLLERFGSPRSIFNADPAHLRELAGAALARALLHPTTEQLQQVERAIAWSAVAGNRILTLQDSLYPATLRNIADAPPLLYVSGRAELLLGPCLAVVGSRNASVQGKTNAEVFAQALSMAGLTIVSGLALGIDTAAHQGALLGAGATIAVIGTGPDLVYPARNRALSQRIADLGCLVSEYAPGTPPLAHNFPQRNRIISGLSAGVLVVEAAAKSGSLITARLAASQGREVFAIPGSIHSALAKGCHVLLKEGAKLVESAADVLQEIAGSPIARMGLGRAGAHEPASDGRDNPDNADNPEQRGILAAIDQGPLDLAAIASACGRAPHELATALLELELAGQAERLPDCRYQRVVRAA